MKLLHELRSMVYYLSTSKLGYNNLWLKFVNKYYDRGNWLHVTCIFKIWSPGGDFNVAAVYEPTSGY